MKLKKFFIVLLTVLFFFTSISSDVLARGGNRGSSSNSGSNNSGSGSSNSGSSNSGPRSIGLNQTVDKPRLELRFPRGLEGCGPFDFTLSVTNRGTGTAKNVIVLVRFKEGSQFISSVSPSLPFVWQVGNVPSGTSKIQNFHVIPNAAWVTAGAEAEIGLFGTVTQETVNPKDNLRRHDNSTADREFVSC